MPYYQTPLMGITDYQTPLMSITGQNMPYTSNSQLSPTKSMVKNGNHGQTMMHI